MNLEGEPFINPIDPDKITDRPGLLPYAHHSGSLPIKPEDEGRLKSRALRAMEYQTDVQLKQIYEQIQVLANQAKALQDRKYVSTLIYQCNLKFEPLIHHVYHLYRKDREWLLSLVAPEDWGRTTTRLIYLASIKLLSDHTWEIQRKSADFDEEVLK
ncbi:MAG: DUF2452 domain-containing protein [Bacteroidetes bacterium]|nr:DUF2452 domain-containing protein [Bacteroidota bacterium]MBM3424378.1 DUF2452 domain-containing protein [Bacteroidota bacterium]